MIRRSVIILFFLPMLWTFNGALPAIGGQKWYETGKLESYPDSRFLTALGYGSTLTGAQKDAVHNLSNQLDSDIHSKYEQKTTRNNLSVSQSTQNNLSIKTHAKLYGLINIRGQFIKSQASFVAMVGVRRADLERYLRGRIRNLQKTIRSLQDDLDQTANPMRQIHDLSSIVRSKENAAFFDREVAVVSGGTPSGEFDAQHEISRIETLLSREMTVRVKVVNACGRVDSFSRQVRGAIEQDVTGMGLLVVPSHGKILIEGHVSAVPMNATFSQRYLYYILRYRLSMAAPNGTIWGSVSRSEKVAGMNKGQAEMLAVRTVSRKGVGPLLAALKSRLFLDRKDPRFVSFPAEGLRKSSAVSALPSSGNGCRNF